MRASPARRRKAWWSFAGWSCSGRTCRRSPAAFGPVRDDPFRPVIEPVRAKGAEQSRAALQFSAGVGTRRIPCHDRAVFGQRIPRPLLRRRASEPAASDQGLLAPVAPNLDGAAIRSDLDRKGSVAVAAGGFRTGFL